MGRGKETRHSCFSGIRFKELVTEKVFRTVCEELRSKLMNEIKDLKETVPTLRNQMSDMDDN